MKYSIARPLNDLVRRYIGAIPVSERVIENIGWLFFERLIRLLAGLTIGVWIARYLGPTQYGQLNYALAFVSLFAPIASLGLKNVVIRSLVRVPENSHTILGSALGMRFLGGVLATIVAITAILLIRPEDSQMHIMVGLISFGMVIRTSEVVSYWYESRVLSKYVVWMQNLTFIVGIIAKLCLLYFEAPLLWFVFTILLEAFVSSAGLLVLYRYRDGTFDAWKFRFKESLDLVRASWPLLLSGLSIMVYMKIDQIMLGELLGERDVGIYSAALRISELWFMVPMIIVSTVFPILLKDKNASPQALERRFRFLTAGLATISLVFAITVTIFSGPLVSLLFGKDFLEAVEILRIHVWVGVFVAIGVAGNQWYLVHDMDRVSLHRTLVGAILNVLANQYLIPIYGIAGAAASTLLSQAVVTYVLDGLSTKTRTLFLTNSKALFIGPYVLWSEMKFIRRLNMNGVVE